MKKPNFNFIAGTWIESKQLHEVKSPFTGDQVAEYCVADATQVEQALQASENSFRKFSKSSRYARSRLLQLMVEELRQNQTAIIDSIVTEAGKPMMLAKVEFQRAIQTLTVAAEEAKRLGGEIIPLDAEVTGLAFGLSRSLWFPRGVVFGITPFNFPLNLVLHKVAPALAAGVSILIKPAPQAPGCAFEVARIFEKAHARLALEMPMDTIPLATLQVLFTTNVLAEKMVTDSRVATVSFTGSAQVGWMLQGKAIGKKVCLELGGNAANIVHEDADLDHAARRLAAGAFAYAGQSCISVQRIYVHQNIMDRLTQKLLHETQGLKSGDPKDEKVLIGPMIDAKAIARVQQWLDSAKAGGAKILCGGKWNGNVLEPTVLSGVPENHPLVCEEAFAPIAVLESYRSFEEAIEKVNASRYGLQAGVFTGSHKLMEYSISNLDVGGVIFNDVSAFRAELMPYGGVKESGLGREGLRYAMEEFSERKMVIEFRG